MTDHPNTPVTEGTPPAPSFGMRAPAPPRRPTAQPCGVRDCPRTDTRLFPFGWRCANHAPPQPTPPPFETTAAGLRQTAAAARKEHRP